MAPTLEELAQRLAASEARSLRSERRARVSGGVAALALGASLLLNVRPAALAQSPGVSLASLVSQINALTGTVNTIKANVAPITTSGTDLTITGVNVHIVDGNPYGRTDDGTAPYDGAPVSGAFLSGLGNLIIGYNNSGTGGGSHNLVLGDQNSFRRFGGLVAGFRDTISAPYASVTGGNSNTASSYFSSVSGGFGNIASNGESSVSGGYRNTASGFVASVSGGNNLTENTDSGWKAGSQGAGDVSGNFASP